MSGLPTGWCSAQLGSLIERIQAGLNVKCVERPPLEDEKGLVKISAVTWGRFNEMQSKTLPADAPVTESVRIRSGDLLFSRANTIELVGATVIVGNISKRLYLSDKVLRLVVPGESKRWVNYAMKSARTRKAIQEASSGNQLSMRNVSQDKLRQITIPLAPLPEQRRITDKLDTVLARVDACRDRLDRLPALLKRFRQSILAAATSGRLTDDIRQTGIQGNAEKEIAAWLKERAKSEKKPPVEADLSHWQLETPPGWTICSVHQFAECLDRLRVPIKRELRKNTGGHFPYYGANGEVGRIDEFIFDDELVLVTEDETFYGRERPIAYRSSGKCWVNNHAHVLRAPTKAANDYLCFALMYYDVLPWLSGTTGRAKLTQQALNALPIACPPANELEEIVRRVDILFAFADRLEARLATARKQVEQLTPAVLAKAFRGELVPQDPADEPAAELLKRLAVKRAAAPQSRRGRKAAPSS